MKSSLRQLLTREIRFPWWVTVLAFAVCVALIGASVWREQMHRREAWNSDDRPRTARLRDYEFFTQHPDLLVQLRETNRLLADRLSVWHPSGAAARNNLACLYVWEGKHSAAIELFRESLTVYERMLGERHEQTRIVRENLRLAESMSDSDTS